MKNMAKACLCRLYYGYLRLLEMTVRLEVEMPDIWTKDMPDRGAVIGFWHEDSFLMNLLLRRLSEGRDIAVIVTSDGRGDYIENIIERCNGKAIRVPDGCRSRDFLRNLIEEAGCPGKTLAAAMDGPLGPRRVPGTGMRCFRDDIKGDIKGGRIFLVMTQRTRYNGVIRI